MNAIDIIEWIAALLGLACVVLTIVENIWCWPTGLLQVLLYIIVFFDRKLYSDVILQVINVGLSVYGWAHWLRGGPRQSALPISRLTIAGSGIWVGVAAVGTVLLGFGMRRWTDAALPYWDSAITALSLVAQYLLTRKVLENWPLWVTVDVLAVGVYFYKGLYVTTGLYLVFLGLAISGWIAWQRSFRNQALLSTPGFEAAGV